MSEGTKERRSFTRGPGVPYATYSFFSDQSLHVTLLPGHIKWIEHDVEISRSDFLGV